VHVGYHLHVSHFFHVHSYGVVYNLCSTHVLLILSFV
jgi:hypothetical protein